jgi:disulfide bond formation protein DsbB
MSKTATAYVAQVKSPRLRLALVGVVTVAAALVAVSGLPTWATTILGMIVTIGAALGIVPLSPDGHTMVVQLPTTTNDTGAEHSPVIAEGQLDLWSN